jgi:hypothetical protein
LSQYDVVGPRHPDQLVVSAGIEDEIPANESVIDINLHAVKISEWRHRAEFTVAECIPEFALVRKPHRICASDPLQSNEIDLTRSWHYGHHHAVIGNGDHRLGNLVSGDVGE